MQAARDRNTLSVESVTYTICRDSIWCELLFSPENRAMTAPRILMSCLFATFILIETGSRSEVFIPIRSIMSTPIKQLWQPVSAMAGSVTDLTRLSSLNPRAW